MEEADTHISIYVDGDYIQLRGRPNVLNQITQHAGPELLVGLKKQLFVSPAIPIHIMRYDHDNQELVVQDDGHQGSAAGVTSGTQSNLQLEQIDAPVPVPINHNVNSRATSAFVHDIAIPPTSLCRSRPGQERPNEKSVPIIPNAPRTDNRCAQDSTSSNVEGEDSKERIHIWANVKTKKAKANDEAATQQLIQLMKRDDIQAKLNDKKTKKMSVFEQVALEMKSHGYILKENGADQIHQKWRNLEKIGRNYINHAKITGESPISPPEFWDELHPILTKKHAIKPIALIDTSDTAQCDDTKENVLNEESGNAGVSEIDKKIRKTKPSHATKVFSLLKSIQDENKNDQHSQRQEREEMMGLFKRQHEERMDSQRQWMSLFSRFLDSSEPAKKPKTSSD